MTTAASTAPVQRRPGLLGHTVVRIVDAPLSTSARRMQSKATGSREDTP
jgi:hypothetical protein